MHLKTCIAAMDAPTAQAVAIAGLGIKRAQETPISAETEWPAITGQG